LKILFQKNSHHLKWSNPRDLLIEYNELGLITKETTEITQDDDEIIKTLEHEYDELGNRVKTTLPDQREVEYSYNEIGAVAEISIDGKIITTIQRDELNRELSRTQGLLEIFKEYDSLGRLISQTAYNKEQLNDVNTLNAEAELLHRSYSYNQAGELESIDDRRLGKTSYNYDDIGQILKTVSPLETEEFNFDPAHNLLDPNTIEQTKVTKNQITTYQDKRYEYDSFGNLSNKKISSHTNIELEYDAEHQLVKSQITKNNKTKIYYYCYDAFGRRVSKTNAFGTTHFIWDGNRLLNENRGNSSQTYIYEQNSFSPLATIDIKNNINYYHTDHLGTPREVTNYQGEIVWEAQYKTWGNTAKVIYKPTESTIQSEEEVEFQPLRFQGQYYDVETGLHYNRFRYYDPDVGRFISQDPIGLMGGTNLYQYAPNPTGWIDPLGLMTARVDPPEGCDCDDDGEIDTYADDSVDLDLKYKDNWTNEQRAAADSKAEALTNADTQVTRDYERGGSTQREYRSDNNLDSSEDADHIIELQLGGSDTADNMQGLDKSVNRSFGSQIKNQIKDLDDGTPIGRVTISDRD
jgi:RHS repeat-associated protein